ncbi:MAG: HAMP domain-containing histidine kinase [Deltaproteobacteria bacterium]|nr:HAMP domain-containing histidine kinase [Deltaproteobacteria bacterium]
MRSPSTPDVCAERPEAGTRFAAEVRALLLARLQVICRLALVLIPAFFVLDLLLHPQVARQLLLIRALMVSCCGAGLLLLRTELGRTWVAPLSLFLVWQTGFGIALMTGLHGGGSSGYYAGINLVMLTAAVLLPWEMRWSLAAAVALIGSYVAVCVLWGGIQEPAIFVQNLFFLGSTGLIMVMSHQARERAHRRELLQRLALEDAGRHRDEFLANITHELRTPLAAILGFTEMLVDYLDGATPEQRAWLGRIHENALTLYRLIVQLLDFSKVEAGALALAREPIDLPSIVAKVAGDMRAIAGEDGAVVETVVPSDVPTVHADAARVEEIVSNLAANALKFSSGRPVQLVLRRDALHAMPWQRVVPDPGPDARGREYLHVEVRDAGAGIRAEDLRRIFVAFLQLDGSSTRRHEGTGLGLAISARLAAAMGGHIAVRSTPGVGSTFALLLAVDEPGSILLDDDPREPASLSA